jgi:hypothetical protein
LVIVDTSVWIDYLRGTENAETSWLDRELQRQRMGLTDLILCEVLQRVQDRRSFSLVQSNLLRFEIFRSGGSALAIAAAKNYRYLREHGYTLGKTIDCLIATFCLRGQHELLHRDHDFDSFENLLGLRVIHPS